MKGYGAISVFDVFKFWLSLGKGGGGGKPIHYKWVKILQTYKSNIISIDCCAQITSDVHTGKELDNGLLHTGYFLY
jgi:hypothetical protein